MAEVTAEVGRKEVGAEAELGLVKLEMEMELLKILLVFALGFSDILV